MERVNTTGNKGTIVFEAGEEGCGKVEEGFQTTFRGSGTWQGS
jgi:hypothetical protein